MVFFVLIWRVGNFVCAAAKLAGRLWFLGEIAWGEKGHDDDGEEFATRLGFWFQEILLVFFGERGMRCMSSGKLREQCNDSGIIRFRFSQGALFSFLQVELNVSLFTKTQVNVRRPCLLRV
jgi:hypothetical protein